MRFEQDELTFMVLFKKYLCSFKHAGQVTLNFFSTRSWHETDGGLAGRKSNAFEDFGLVTYQR